MKRYFSYISLILASIVLSDEITLTTLTPFFTVDTEAPSTEWIYPSGGNEFDGGETIALEWNASDINLTDNPITIEFKAELGGQYEIIFYNLENSGSADFTLPDISTEYARFKVVASDQYGYQNFSESDYFTIIDDDGGDDGGGTFEQEITLTTLTNFFTVDTQTPEVTVTYPNGGETFNEGQMVNVSWSASDINLADNPVSISLSVGQGSNYETVAYSLENSGQYTATLPYTQTEYARFKVDVFDNFGYSNSDESDEYFTIGQTEDEEYLDSTLVITALTDFFTVDTEDPSTWSNIRIATKYPNLTKSFYAEKGVQVEAIKLNGSMELAPTLSMCRRIVDLVSTGKTLKENGLKEIEKIMDVQTKLIVNRSSYKTNTKEIESIIKTFNNIIQ